MTLQQHTPDQQPQHGNATANDHVRFSIIVPVFNRPDEVDELLDSNQRAGSDELEIYMTANSAGNEMLLISVFDNLGKGSSGAAVQCMNVLLGRPETAGLE